MTQQTRPSIPLFLLCSILLSAWQFLMKDQVNKTLPELRETLEKRLVTQMCDLGQNLGLALGLDLGLGPWTGALGLGLARV